MPIPNVDFSKSQDGWDLPVVFPAERGGVVDVASGAFRGRGRITSHLSETALKRNEVIVHVYRLPNGVAWLEGDDSFDAVCAISLSGNELIYLRDATDAEKTKGRVPVFIQNLDYPVCCGRSMVFVGQIDDDRLCTEPPPDAKQWWHDRASFYVYTCCICLECKATGQQF